MQLDKTGYDDGWGYSSQIDAWIHEDSGVYYRRPSGMEATADGLALTRGQQEASGSIALDDHRGLVLMSNEPLVEIDDQGEVVFDSYADHQLRWRKFPVLDDGFVTLVDWMGDDDAVVQAARVSYGRDVRDYESIPGDVRDQLESDLYKDREGCGSFNKKDVLKAYLELKRADHRKLLRFLMRMHHTTPFEMCEVKLLIRCPMDVWRQWIRHRTASVNEYSTRYTTAIDSAQKTKPEEWRLQSKSNKQGSSGLLHDQGKVSVRSGRCPDEQNTADAAKAAAYFSEAEEALQKKARHEYEERLRFGIASEQARKDLPLSTYTEAYWKIDLHNLFHFLSKRMDSAAQLEIRSYANIIGEQIVAQLFPECWQAFLDYKLNAMTLTALEVELLQQHLGPELGFLLSGDSSLVAHERMDPKREFDDFKKKLVRLSNG